MLSSVLKLLVLGHEESLRANGIFGQISLRLDPDVAHNSSVPKDYVFQSMTSDAENMFVFSEKDLPGYKSKGPSDFAPRSYLYEKTKAENKSREERRKKFEPYIKRAIPKQTALAGAIKFEANCNPVPNDEYRRMMDERAMSRILKKPRAVELDEAQSKQRGLFARGRTELGQDFIVSVLYPPDWLRY
jgi:transcription initiation factor TFIIF subunit beta